MLEDDDGESRSAHLANYPEVGAIGGALEGHVLHEVCNACTGCPQLLLVSPCTLSQATLSSPTHRLPFTPVCPGFSYELPALT